MGSILNFIFENSENDINGGKYCQMGQLRHKVLKNYSFTTNFRLKNGFKNILFYITKDVNLYFKNYIEFVLFFSNCIKKSFSIRKLKKWF